GQLREAQQGAARLPLRGVHPDIPEQPAAWWRPSPGVLQRRAPGAASEVRRRRAYATVAKPAKEQAMKAVLYARYSTDMQRSTSIGDQGRNCRRRADGGGWTITATYSDEAISGSDANRPQYQAMLAAAKRGEFDVLLVDDLSRL